MDLTDAVDDLLRDEQDQITQKIDEELAKVNLKHILKRTWEKLNNPIRINRQVQPVYLLVQSSGLQLYDFHFSEHILSLDLGVSGHLQTVYDSSSYVRDKVPYPPLTIDSTGTLENALYLPIEVEFQRLNQSLADRLQGQAFTAEGRTLKVDSVHVTSADSLLLIFLEVSGDVEVDVEMLGRPEFVPEKRVLTVEGFDYQVRHTDHSLLSLGDYLFHDDIIEALVQRMNVPIGSFIDTIPELIYRGVERGRSGDKLNLVAALDSVAVDQLYIGASDIALVIYARGGLRVEVEKIAD